ncbi:NAD(P)-binding protein [Serendipita vermifera]|nr:NAD(P)-binding protein [Serendipita vermifera]
MSEQLQELPLAQKDLTGRTVIVTGSNVGLGLEAARHLYGMNTGRLILAVRNVDKGEAAKQSIVDSANKKGETKVDVWELDLNSFDSVKRFAKRCNEELDRLDIFLANAGVAAGQFLLTNDGYEVSVQTNVLSTFLVSTLVLPLLNKTASLPAPVEGVKLKPHLVIASSEVHFGAKFSERDAPSIYEALNNPSTFEIFGRYPVTKLMEVLLVRQLSRSPAVKRGTDGNEVVMCSVTPGFCRSELSRNLPDERRKAMRALPALTTEEGSKNFVWASLEDDIPEGGYVAKCAVAPVVEWIETAEGERVQTKLWKETGEIVTKIAPETADVWRI